MIYNNYPKEKTIEDNKEMESLYENFWQTVRAVAKKTIKEFVNEYGIEASSYAVVTDITSATKDSDDNIISVERASVTLSNGEKINNLYNSSGVILNVGDTVKIYGSITNLSNRYIGIKYERGISEEVTI